MELQILKSIFEVNETDWHQIVPSDFPFMSYQFLGALESTNCLGVRTGWEPQIVTVTSKGKLLGAMISYIRNNSFGEYIFDFQWADAFARYGQEYYPKLTSAIPFTPATGRKILLRSDLEVSVQQEVGQRILSGLKNNADKLDLSSAHALFITPEEIPDFEASGFFIRDSFQYHWKNKDYKNFQEFLKDLRSKRRTEILRERAQVQSSGVRISKITGNELTAAHSKIMYDFYISTMEKKSGFDFLTADFFDQVFSTMKNQILFVMAEKNGKPVAGALSYFGKDAIYGRHWGCLAEYRALHFELCYYQGIEFAIDRKISLFEGGAQGDHKFHRGFLPCMTYSAHLIRSAPFAQAIRKAVTLEAQELKGLFEYSEAHSPYSRGLK